MPKMRTTLTLDPDVLQMIQEEVHRRRATIKEVVNDALRRGLSGKGAPSAPRRYRVRPHRTALRPGYDRAGFNKLADDLEDQAVLSRRGRR